MILEPVTVPEGLSGSTRGAGAGPQLGRGCPNCGLAMQQLTLSAHYGRQVTIDLCRPCHLLWFDQFESVNLAPYGVLQLARAVMSMQQVALTPTAAEAHCPQCRMPLREVVNRTRYGRQRQYHCPQRHGHMQPFSQALAERGLLRPVSLREWADAQKSEDGVLCAHCGADCSGIPSRAFSPDTDTPTCPYCRSALLAVDVQALLRSVDAHGAALELVRRTGGSAHALADVPAVRREVHCTQCGAAVDAATEPHCGRCGHVVTVTRLDQLLGLLDALEPIVREHHARPPAKAVEARLAAIGAPRPPPLGPDSARRAALQEGAQRAGSLPFAEPAEASVWQKLLLSDLGAGGLFGAGLGWRRHEDESTLSPYWALKRAQAMLLAFVLALSLFLLAWWLLV
jgi:Zn-finger nucleic acid-binding protein